MSELFDALLKIFLIRRKRCVARLTLEENNAAFGKQRDDVARPDEAVPDNLFRVTKRARNARRVFPRDDAGQRADSEDDVVNEPAMGCG